MRKKGFLLLIVTLLVTTAEASQDLLQKITSKHYVPRTISSVIPLLNSEQYAQVTEDGKILTSIGIEGARDSRGNFRVTGVYKGAPADSAGIKSGDLSEVTDSDNFEVVEILEVKEIIEDNDEKKITVFTTGCPMCKILEAKLKEKNVQYEEITDVEQMTAMGLKQVPWLRTETGEMLNFTDALKWINNLK